MERAIESGLSPRLLRTGIRGRSMLDATGKKLLALLGVKHSLELRCAAAQMLGEIAPRDAQVSKAICECLEAADEALRIQAIIAAGKLQVSQALPLLLERIKQGGPESEAAADAAAQLGTKGTEALQALMGQVAPGLRRRIAAALGGAGTEGAETAALGTLLDSDPGVVDAAVRSLTREVSSLAPDHRKKMAEQALAMLKPRRGMTLALVSEIALVRLLGALGDGRAESALWSRLDATHSVEIRAASLQALGTGHFTPNRDKVKALLACTTETDFRVAAPALMMLKAVAPPEKSLTDWLPMFTAPDPAVRRFAMEKLAERDTPEVARALLAQVRFPDTSIRQDAIARLGRLKHGRDALAQGLLDAETSDDAWALANAQMALAAEHPAKVRSQVFSRACEYLEEGDRRADPLLALLRKADNRGLRDQLEERALSLRKKKKYASALTYLRLLTRDPACAETIRFEVAACGLKESAKDLAAEARAADPCLQHFARLVHNPETPPLERIKQAKWLEPEELFYLGFHFAESDRREREFGGEILELLMERSPKTKLAKDAKSKLRSAGLA